MIEHNKRTKGKDILDDITWKRIIISFILLIVMYILLYLMYKSIFL